MMRIVVVGPRPPLRGGIASHTEGLIDALQARGDQVLAISYDRLFPRWIAGARPGSVPRSSATGPEIAVDCYAPRSWRRAAAKAREFAPDVVIAQYWTPVVAAAIGVLFSGVVSARRILVCHNVVPHEWFPGRATAARWLWRRCDGVIFHSRYVRARAETLGCRCASSVAPVPLLTGDGDVAIRPPAELATDFAVGARMFVCPGHVRGYKGLGVLASAWRRAAMAEDALLVIAGEALAARRELHRLQRLGSRVRIVSRYLDEGELGWLLSHAEAVLLPYLSASQSGLLPTALRTARHVVHSDAGGLTEQASGIAAAAVCTKVPAGDVESLAAALRELDRRPIEGLGPHANGAPRHDGGPISQVERRESWRSFLCALDRVLGGNGLPGTGLE